MAENTEYPEYNHEAETLKEATGVAIQDVEEKFIKLANSHDERHEKPKQSTLIEELENNLTKRELAVYAYANRTIVEKMQNVGNPIEQFLSYLSEGGEA